MTHVILNAPLGGIVLPIEDVPDPVFAQKLVGDGIAVDPLTSALLAPCDGIVAQLHDSQHAISLATPDGLEILMHIGLDTVQLKGEGFLPHVRTGDVVKAGDTLIEFDADYIALNAPSLLTMIVVTNGDMVAEWRKAHGDIEAGALLMDLRLAGTPTAPTTNGTNGTSDTVTSDPIRIPNPTGLHARPAAVLATSARTYQSDIRIIKDGQSANAKSVVGIMSLGVGPGATVQLAASGPDAQAAIAALAPMVRDGLGETGAAPAQASANVPVAPVTTPIAVPAQPQPRAEDPNMLLGVTASPGIAAGQVYQLRHSAIVVAEQGAGPEAEQRRLHDALGSARGELEALQARLAADADANKAAIFAAHAQLIDDPDLLDQVNAHIANGKSAAWAWQTAVDAQAGQLSAVQNEVIAQRANDMRDVGRRVLEKLAGVATERRDLPPNTILIAEDLTPSDTATLDRSRVLGFATTLGGATSHVAILARSLDMPAIAGIDARALDVPNGTPVILDGTQGRLRLNPSPDEMTRLQQTLHQQRGKHQGDLAAAHEPAITTDGHQLEIVANIGGLADAEQAVKLGGEGVGLLRTEFLFMERSTAPTEAEQADVYTAIARALGPDRPLIIRTLDVGGDKPLPYVPLPPEANPFLGERGIRIGLNRPELLRTQIRAILRASQAGRVLVMFPMIATLNELQTAKRVVEEERADLGVAPIPVGIMVEVPAVAVMAEQFAREADFFSIGTNDLTQYTMAMDRGHPKLAAQIDGLNPAVLQLIALTVEGARKHGKWVGVCGGIAGDAHAVPLLVGMGVKELSVSVPAIPAVKAQVRTLDVAQCQTLAAQAVAQPDGAHVRALVAAANGEA